jgi:hypothetical protein
VKRPPQKSRIKKRDLHLAALSKVALNNLQGLCDFRTKASQTFFFICGLEDTDPYEILAQILAIVNVHRTSQKFRSESLGSHHASKL